MPRIHLFEFTDQPWYPATFRRMQTDYLQTVTSLGAGHQNLVPIIQRALAHAHTTRILDLCSGGAGPWLGLQKQLEQAGTPVTIQLSDMYPNPQAAGKWAGRQGLEYLPEPVDARCVPPSLEGMRTLFEGFHHFKPDQARAVLSDAVAQRAAIGAFEASLKPPLGLFLLLLAPLSTLLGYLLLTPFIRPRRLSRFVWTYLIPLVPLATCWDGVVSMLRVYSLAELHALAGSLGAVGYTWEIGKASTGTPVFDFTYIVGYPK